MNGPRLNAPGHRKSKFREEGALPFADTEAPRVAHAQRRGRLIASAEIRTLINRFVRAAQGREEPPVSRVAYCNDCIRRSSFPALDGDTQPLSTYCRKHRI